MREMVDQLYAALGCPSGCSTSGEIRRAATTAALGRYKRLLMTEIRVVVVVVVVVVEI